MDKKKLFLLFLVDKNKSLLKMIEKAKDARDNAPSAMESHSDTRRSQAEKMVIELESELSHVVKTENKVDTLELNYIEVEVGSKLQKFLIVPKGMGGSVVNDVRLISLDTLLGSLIENKKIGEVVEFNNQKIKIIRKE